MRSVLLLFIVVLTCFGEDSLVITFGFREDTRAFRVTERYVKEINRRTLSLPTLSLRYQPFARARESLINGKTSGDILRAAMVYTASDSVVRIPTPIDIISFYQYGLPSFLEKKDSIPPKEIRYITTLGLRTVINWLELNDLEYHAVADYRQAMRMVAMGRSDCLVMSDLNSNNATLKESGLVRSDSALFVEPLYLFMHSRYEVHVPELSRVVEELSQERYIARELEDEISENEDAE